METVVMNLCQNWKFALGEHDDAWYKGYDDCVWEEVTLPHDWSVHYPFSQKYPSGTGYVCGGTGWYRLNFSLPEEFRGKCIRVVFDGVYKNSQVWCNSYYLGKRPNGYITFSYDLTSFLNYGDADNVISVKVTHEDLADSRWFTGSGITRKASLVIEELVHPKEYGVFFKTKSINENKAYVEIEHEIINKEVHPVELTVQSELLDCEQQSVFKSEQKMILKEEEQGKCVVAGTVCNPRLWSPQKPKLYQLVTSYSVDGSPFYAVGREYVGIRTFCFDADKGFYLNGLETKIKGVCLHHDGGCLGAAMTREIWARRLSELKECGCNAVRCSHNPQMPELYELCDSMGFMVMDEAFDEWENAKNKWVKGHNVYPPSHQGYYEEFPQWHEKDLTDMIKRDRNHPSVILWSVGNEIDYPNDPYGHPLFQDMTGNNDANKPAKEREYDPFRPDASRLPVLAAKLVSIAKKTDNSRPVTIAVAFPELSAQLGYLDPLDVVGYNYKEQFYEHDHKRFPDKPFLGSENDHSYEAWLAVRDLPYISGQFLWTGIDYLGETLGWPLRGSRSGLLTCAGARKPEFYRRKSFWSSEPVLHITTCKINGNGEKEYLDSWNHQDGEIIEVVCFSNLPYVRLYLNDIEIGHEDKLTQNGDYSFSVPYRAGILKAVSYDKEMACVTEILETTGAASNITFNLWDREKQRDLLLDEELYQVEIQLCDKNGRITVWDDKVLEIQVSGSGELVGIESGDLYDVTPYCSAKRKTYMGKMICYVSRKGCGGISISARADLRKRVEAEYSLDS